MRKLIAVIFAILMVTAGPAVAASATSPDTPYPFWWGTAYYQITGEGLYVSQFKLAVFNGTDRTLLVSFSISGPREEWGPINNIPVAPCATWRGAISPYRNEPPGSYWVHYTIVKLGSGMEHLSWAWTVK